MSSIPRGVSWCAGRTSDAACTPRRKVFGPGGETVNRSISVTVNGISHHHEVEPRLLLVYYLREVLGLTGTHIGCDTTSCGTCTVLMNGQAVKSCTRSEE